MRQDTECIRKGTRYSKEKKRLVWEKEMEMIDVEDDKEDVIRIGEVCLEAMNGNS